MLRTYAMLYCVCTQIPAAIFLLCSGFDQIAEGLIMVLRTALVSTIISCLVALGVLLASVLSGRRSAGVEEPEGPRFELLLQ